MKQAGYEEIGQPIVMKNIIKKQQILQHKLQRGGICLFLSIKPEGICFLANDQQGLKEEFRSGFGS
jgi:hypothetical protein